MPVIEGGNIIEGAIERGSAPDAIMTAMVNIPHSEVQSLRTAPKVLVDAPASGKAIFFHGMTIFKGGGSTAYAITASNTLRVGYGTTSPDNHLAGATTDILTGDTGAGWWAVSTWSTNSADTSRGATPAEDLVLFLNGSNDITGGDAGQNLFVNVFYQIVEG